VRIFKRVSDLEDGVEALELLIAELLLGEEPKSAKERPRDRALPPGGCRPPAPVPSPNGRES
jgi:hypothetical protein